MICAVYKKFIKKLCFHDHQGVSVLGRDFRHEKMDALQVHAMRGHRILRAVYCTKVKEKVAGVTKKKKSRTETRKKRCCK